MNDSSTEMPLKTSVEDILALLLKQHNITEGWYILNLSFELAAGQMPLPSNQKIGVPSLHFAITDLSLQPVPEHIPGAVNASLVNPKRKNSRKAKPKDE